MTREETKKLLMMISAIYPNFVVANEKMTPVIDAWHWALNDYPADAVLVALQIYIKTNGTAFAPSAAQLISAMHESNKQNTLSEGEAWSLVKRAIQDGAYHAEERFNELPELVQKAVGSPNIIHQWSQTDTSEVNTVIMSNFQRAYKTVVQRKEFNDRVPIELAGVVNEIAAKITPQIGVGEGD